MATRRKQTTIVKRAARDILARCVKTTTYSRTPHRETTMRFNDRSVFRVWWHLDRHDDERGSFKRDAALQRRLVELLREECDLAFVDVWVDHKWLGSTYFDDVEVESRSGMSHRWAEFELIAGVSYDFCLGFYDSERFRDARAGHNKTLK